MRRFTQYFLRGLVVLVPLGLTGYVFYLLFTWVDQLLPFYYPGAGFVIVVVLTVLIGYLASNFLIRRLFNWIESGIEHIPFVSVVYRSMREIVNAVVGDKPRFQHPVRVRLTAEGDAYLLGFVTKEQMGADALEGHVAVYLPWSYNIGGHLLVLPAEQVERVEASSSEVMSFVLSGGLVGDPATEGPPSA